MTFLGGIPEIRREPSPKEITELLRKMRELIELWGGERGLAHQDVLYGRILKEQYAQYGANDSTTVTIPASGVPQNTAGKQFMDAEIIPPDDATHLEVWSQGHFSKDGSFVGAISMAAFLDTLPNAFCSTIVTHPATSHWRLPVTLYDILPVTGKAMHIKIRAGSTTGGTLTFNGWGATNQDHGGVLSSFLRLRAIKL